MFRTSYDKAMKLWRGPDFQPLYNPQISLAQVLLNSMSIFGSRIAQISDNNGIRMTFGEIKMKTIRAAQNLQKFECEPGDVFMLIAKNSENVAPITFATIAIGCVLNALDASFGQTELIHMMKITKPKIVFCDLACYDLVDASLKKTECEARIFCFGGKFGRSESVESLFKETQSEHQFIPVKVNGQNDPAMILCSSGTTGLPKGISLSHAAILDAMERYGSNCDDVMLCFSSLYWASGVITLIRGTLCGACRINTTEVFSPQLQLHLIEKYKVTLTINAPHQLILMMKGELYSKIDLSSLKDVMVGGSKVPSHVKTSLIDRVPDARIAVCYGLTETVGPITLNAQREIDSVGHLPSGCIAKIVDDDGNNCDVNVDGEICIKTNYRFLGYFDKDGELFIVDRKKELMKYCNFPIVPSEIDAFLTESPEIRMACVVGIPDSLGELPAAVVVRTEGSNISEEEVCELVAGHFADHYKLRGGCYFVNTLPTTPSGKVLRREVAKMAIAFHNDRKF